MRISIIMPLYNAEKYLAESLESVLNQTFRDFELLCIDDCSTDGTGTILHDFKQKDSRIRIINNSARQGAALSRNTGIKAAKGDYLIFLDGDDIFDEELLLTTFNTAEATKADIVMFDYMHVNTNEIYIKRNVKHGETYIAKYCSDVFSVKKQKPYEFVGWHSAACNKLYRKTFIEENHLEFQDLESSNDVYFSYMSL